MPFSGEDVNGTRLEAGDGVVLDVVAVGRRGDPVGRAAEAIGDAQDALVGGEKGSEGAGTMSDRGDT